MGIQDVYVADHTHVLFNSCHVFGQSEATNYDRPPKSMHEALWKPNSSYHIGLRGTASAKASLHEAGWAQCGSNNRPPHSVKQDRGNAKYLDPC